MIVQRVHLAERRAHFANLRQQPAGQFGQRQESLFQIDPFLAERDEEIGARVRIDDRLQR